MTNVEYKACCWDALLNVLDRKGFCLSETQAERLVGGKKHLQRLVAENKIYPTKGRAKNSPWRYKATEIYKHIKN